jgi:hypothetical protein
MAWQRSVRLPVVWPHQLVAQLSRKPLKCCSGVPQSELLLTWPDTQSRQLHCYVPAVLLFDAEGSGHS